LLESSAARVGLGGGSLVHLVPHPCVREAEELAHVLREAVVVVGHEVAVLRRRQSLALAQPAAEEENGPERVVQRGRMAILVVERIRLALHGDAIVDVHCVVHWVVAGRVPSS